MTRLKHPNILPEVVIEVAPDRVASHLAAGWLPLAEEAPEPDEAEEADTTTPARPRRSRRAGSDSTKETAE